MAPPTFRPLAEVLTRPSPAETAAIVRAVGPPRNACAHGLAAPPSKPPGARPTHMGSLTRSFT
ncbi:hypothetical protein [Streptomyces longisporoflavus]|uniref:hypothetical protein n=1 Tax=Streptomyces longisporoflavus TaxID=28044 RepID=UPI00167CAC57|nr:hypothetical protein [Streptomyces longisporoflavus]